MASPPRTNVTLEEYFPLDEASGVTLEYFGGQAYAMARWSRTSLLRETHSPPFTRSFAGAVRQPNGRWGLTPAGTAEDVIKFSSRDCRLKMAEMFESRISGLGAADDS
jgi:hypothetical protein